ncbi:uncharacterized protein LOC132813375, partial [Hemiscyllium ocellatum]
PPTPLKITRQYSPFLALLCTTAGFFPGQFELVWYKNLSEITSGINIRKIVNEEGLFHVSSELSLPEKGSVYTCQISHITRSVPANISDKIPNHGNQDRTFYYALVFGCAAGGIMILVLGIVFKGCKLDKTTGNATAEDMNSQFEEQVNRDREAVSPIYAALHFSGERKPAKLLTEKESFVYAQTKHRTAGELTYASLNLSASEKTARKPNKKEAEYAEVKIKKGSGNAWIP